MKRTGYAVLILTLLIIPLALLQAPGVNAQDELVLAFNSGSTSTADIYVLTIPDNPGAGFDDPVQLTDGGASAMPVWSPDGTQIVFISNRHDPLEDQSDLYLMDANGENIRRLTHEGADSPHWSPDGQYIAFETLRTGDREVFIIDVESGEEYNVSNNSAGLDANPVWRPFAVSQSVK